MKIPDLSEINIHPDSAYLHLTSNETIEGAQFQSYPDTGNVPLIGDMSSDILSRPVDVSKFGMIYAGAQKSRSIRRDCGYRQRRSSTGPAENNPDHAAL